MSDELAIAECRAHRGGRTGGGDLRESARGLHAPADRPRFPTTVRRRSASVSACERSPPDRGRNGLHSAPRARVERVAQPVAEQVVRHDRQNDRETEGTSPPTTPRRRSSRPWLMMLPHDAVGCGTPSPRNDSAASVRITSPIARLAATITGERVRQHVAQDHPHVRHTERPRRLDELALLEETGSARAPAAPRPSTPWPQNRRMEPDRGAPERDEREHEERYAGTPRTRLRRAMMIQSVRPPKYPASAPSSVPKRDRNAYGHEADPERDAGSVEDPREQIPPELVGSSGNASDVPPPTSTTEPGARLRVAMMPGWKSGGCGAKSGARIARQ